jgi:hypothetical protein
MRRVRLPVPDGTQTMCLPRPSRVRGVLIRINPDLASNAISIPPPSDFPVGPSDSGRGLDKAFNVLADHIGFDVDGIAYIFFKPMVVRPAVWGMMLTSNVSAVAAVDGQAGAVHGHRPFFDHIPGQGFGDLVGDDDGVGQRAFLSRRMPVPSTWPETKWPSNRSDSRRARSRLTRSPILILPSMLRFKVSGDTSTVKWRFLSVTAVRQAPLTAMLSPIRVPVDRNPIRFPTGFPARTGGWRQWCLILRLFL